jgi:hypothetical protein
LRKSSAVWASAANGTAALSSAAKAIDSFMAYPPRRWLG